LKNGYTWAVDADIRRGHEMYDRRTQQKRLRGWYEYFKHSHKTTFPRIDSWIRMRLRSILRKSRGGKGRCRGAGHQRRPNAYLANLGLFTLTAAHALVCQSRRVTTDWRAISGRPACTVRREGRRKPSPIFHVYFVGLRLRVASH